MSIARSDVDSELSRGSPPGDLYRDRKAITIEAASISSASIQTATSP